MPLIARESEMADVVDQLRQHRLVTIVGPGGVGKTALARAAADIVGPGFTHGALTVDLTRVDDPAAVAELIAGQLGVADFASLINSPSDQPALLVIDNCEHVLDAAAAAIDTILASCRMPTVLATSRSPLDVAEEVIVSLAPLAVPAPDFDEPDAAAVQMFTERVAHFGGTVRPGDLGIAAEICRRLDGVPLALEIAAARSRTTTLGDIFADIDARPSHLARPRFRGHSAHRSVTHTVEWSLQLLAPAVQTAFEHLGVIAGPFDVAMADAVIADGGSLSTADVLDELVTSSLVVADTTGSDSWYRLLHPVRAVSLERLREAGGEVDAIDRAVGHVVEVAIGVVLGSSAGWDDQLQTLLAMYDNTIASLRWANDHDSTPDRSLTLLAVLWGVVHQSHTAEIGSVGEAVLERWTDRNVPFWADAAATVATCRNLLGRHDQAIELATEALDHVGASPFAPASLRRVVAQASRATGRTEQACEWFAAGAEAAESGGVHGLSMELSVDHAVLVAELGDPARADEILDVVIEEAERREASINLAWAMCGRGAVRQRWQQPEALAVLQSALDFSMAIGYPAGVSFSLRLIAAEQLELDDRPAAAGALSSLLDALLERGGLNDLRMVLDHAARLLERVGNERWVDLAATAHALPVTTVAASVGGDIFERAAGRGEVLSTRDAYALCRSSLSEILDAANPPDSDAPTTPDIAKSITDSRSLRREGDVWRWTFAGESVAVKASKGMTDLARLLADPGREISALDLMGSAKAGDVAAETLDVRARREIEDRIRDLQSDVEEAEDNHDPVRAERASLELDQLVDELSAAVGLGGRARAAGSDPERARSAVTQRIRATIGRIDRMHRKLGGHLATSVETGTFCVYRPGDAVEWEISR